MPAILSLETSTDVCSVALHARGKLLAKAEIHEPQSHASRLAPMIDQVVREGGMGMKDINAIAIAKGPGSYTGLRIGASTAKGLCFALNIPLIAIGTLELLAFQGNQFNSENALLCPMIDARRMEVYCLVTDSSLRVIEPISARIVEENTFAELLEANRVLFIGDGSAKCREVIRHPNAVFIPDIYPLATSLGQMAVVKFNAGDFAEVMDFTPLYLKEFVAKKAGARG